jgi:hypothetical protein
VYSSNRITDLLERKGVVPVRVDMTSKSARTKAAQRLLNSMGAYSIPFMTVHPSGEDWARPWRFRDIVTRGEVAEVLERLPDATAAAR